MKRLVIGSLVVLFILNLLQVLALNMAYAASPIGSVMPSKSGGMKSSGNNSGKSGSGSGGYRKVEGEENIRNTCEIRFCYFKSVYLTMWSAYHGGQRKKKPSLIADIFTGFSPPAECTQYWDYANFETAEPTKQKGKISCVCNPPENPSKRPNTAYFCYPGTPEVQRKIEKGTFDDYSIEDIEGWFPRYTLNRADKGIPYEHPGDFYCEE